MTRVLVTGGHGFIGNRVVRRLLDHGDAVRCLVRPGSDTSRINGLAWECATGDVRDAAAILDAMADCAACVHLASVSSWEGIRSEAVESTAIEGVRNVLEAARRVGARRVVVVSSAAAINASRTPRLFDESSPFELAESGLRYAIAKHRAEDVAREYAANGLDVVIVNPVETYGPDDTGFVTAGNLRDALQSWPALACRGGSGIAHVDDVANGIVLALDKGRSGERYILGGENLTIAQLIRRTLAIGGQSGKPVVVLPNRLLVGLVGALTLARLPTPVLPDVLAYATRYWFMNDTKARHELGYTSRPAREILEPTIAWLRAAGHVQ
jgi:dihydroflavonol-4-reductase